MRVDITKKTFFYENVMEEVVYSVKCSYVPGVSERRTMLCADCGKKYKNYWAMNWSEKIKRRICPECFNRVCGFMPEIVSAKRFMTMINKIQFDTYEEAVKYMLDLVGGTCRKARKNK